MGIAVLGPLEVDGDATRLTQRDRVVLAALALRPGTVQPPEALADALWGEHPPASWAKVVQGCVVRIRKALGPAAVATAPHGYRLALHGDDLDHVRFERLAGRTREALAADEPDRAAYLAEEGLRLWRGQPFPDLVDWAVARPEVERLTELFESVREAAVEATVRRGHGADAVAEAVRLVRDAPFRERRWGLLALAQYRAGRQQDALATLQRARSTLVEELGLDPGPELATLARAILDQDPALAAGDVLPEADTRCPYPGLVAYDVGDATVFHGREGDVATCLRRLDEAGVLAVVGPSGIGKSSVVRAGVAAALRRDGVRVDVVTPGSRPLDALRGIGQHLDDVLVVDQLEEVLAPDVSEEERTAFLDALRDRAGRRRLVVSLRADRIGDLAVHPGPAQLLERGLVLLGPMSDDDLRQAIEGPAREAGLRVEAGLVDLLVAEVSGEPAALPLLSHVLRATWAHREGRVLTLDGYRASGGVRDAVAQTAESVYRDLDAPAQRAIRDLMLRLVTPGPDGIPMATRLPSRAVPTDTLHAEAVERLLRARLLGSDGTTVAVAHEALADAWPRLRSWLDEDVEGQQVMRHLAVSAHAWDELGRPESELYRGTRAARAAEWQERSQPSLTEVERDFLEETAALVRREERATAERLRLERRSNQRLRTGLAAVAALLAVAVVASAVAVTQTGRAEEQAVVADARRLGAEAARTDDIDRALLLAVAGQHLHDSPDTRAAVLEALDRAPALARARRLDAVATSVAVSPTTGVVAVSTPEIGLAFHDGTTLASRSVVDEVRGPTVVALPDGRWVASVRPDEIGTGGRPALSLLRADGSPEPTGFGGFPAGSFTHQHFSASPDGRWVVAHLTDLDAEVPHPVGVWDVRDPARPVALLDVGDEVGTPVISDDGTTVYVISGSTVKVVEVPSGRTRHVVTDDEHRLSEIFDGGIALSPRGDLLAVSGGSRTALIDTATLRRRAVLETGPGTARPVFSRDGERLAVTGDATSVWSLVGNDPVDELWQEGAGGWAAFSPDGATLTTVDFSGLVQSFDLRGERRVVPSEDVAVAQGGGAMTRWSPDGTKVAWTNPQEYGRPPVTLVHDTATGTVREIDPGVHHQGFLIDLAWSPDSRRLTVVTGERRIVLVDVTGGTPAVEGALEGTPAAEGHPEGVAFAWWTPDGESLLVGSTTGRLHVLDARTLAPRRSPVQVTEAPEPSTAPSGLYGFYVSHDGRTVVAEGAEVDLASGDVSRPEAMAAVFTAAWSPDGTRIFTSAEDGAVGILDARSRRWVSPPTPAHPFRAWRSAWSPDGSRVTSTADGQVGTWDGTTGEFLGATDIGTDGDVRFSPDGGTVLVAGDDGRILRWSLDPSSWTAAACRLAGRDLTREEWSTHLGERPYEPVCG